MMPRFKETRKDGFTIIEVIVSLFITGLIMGALGLVMGQIVQNDTNLRATQGASSQEAILRRLLHRDIQGIQKPLQVAAGGFTLNTSHNMLLNGPLPVDVAWTFTGGQVRRYEVDESLDYSVEQVLIPKLKSWRLSVLDPKQNRWLNLIGSSMKDLSAGFTGIYLHLETDAMTMDILERIPFTWVQTNSE
jgi:prepilin-type N-terminal cleavage/methylation domain-containing protein